MTYYKDGGLVDGPACACGNGPIVRHITIRQGQNSWRGYPGPPEPMGLCKACYALEQRQARLALDDAPRHGLMRGDRRP